MKGKRFHWKHQGVYLVVYLLVPCRSWECTFQMCKPSLATISLPKQLSVLCKGLHSLRQVSSTGCKHPRQTAWLQEEKGNPLGWPVLSFLVNLKAHHRTFHAIHTLRQQHCYYPGQAGHSQMFPYSSQ